MPITRSLSLLLTLMLCGCAGHPVPSPITPYTLRSGELYDFIQEVATNRSTVGGFVAGQKVRGVYLVSDRCAKVAVLTLSPNGFITGIHHYRACRGEASEYGVGEVPPSYPFTPDARLALDNARRHALLDGEQRVHYQRYSIVARRVGISDDRHCAPVETVITNADLIVLQDTSTLCR